jgi:hypothetical protein
MRFPLFVNGAYRALSPTADDEQTINWYPEILKQEAPGAVAEIVLYPTPGIETFLTVTETAGGRAAYALNNRCFFVVGSKLVEVFSDGHYELRGDVGNDGKPAQMVSSGLGSDQLLVASAGQVYCLDLLTNVLALALTINDAAIAPGPAHYTHVGLSYLFFQAFDVSDSVFRISAGGELLDGMVWDGLDWQSRSLQGDPWKAMLVTSYGETWLMGELSSEVWYNNGDPLFPYMPDPSGSIPYGIIAPFSVCEAADKVVWLATTADGDRQVVAAQGFTPKRISDLALEAELDTYLTVEDAEGETYREAGHAFYKLTFPTEEKTWVFDFQTELWHRRGTWITERDTFDEWQPTWHCFFDRKHLWCERHSGKIVEVSPEFVHDADGRPLRRVRVSPTIRSENKRLVHKRLEVLIEAGLGPVAGPKMMLRASDDGGKTWGNELMQPMGDIGQTRQRLVWEKLGQSVARTYELSCSEAMSVRVIDAFTEVD